jgi:L-rhamnose mutarotase
MHARQPTFHPLFTSQFILVLLSAGLGLSRIAGIPVQALAFSPYETYILSGQDTRVGLIAKARSGQERDVKQALLQLGNPRETELLKQAGISNLACFSREIDSDTWYFVYFEYGGDKEYLRAAEAFKAATPKIRQLSQLMVPAGADDERRWAQMEWISFIRGKNVPDKPQVKLSMVTTLRQEKELQYRALHQAIWPGVVDQMIRRNNRNFSAFLHEIDGELYEFLYVEYVGSDAEKDNALNQQHPLNRRWWKLTDECQKPLPGEDAIWVKMELISVEN